MRDRQAGLGLSGSGLSWRHCRRKRPRCDSPSLECGSLALAESARLPIVAVWDALGESVMCGPRMGMSDQKVRGYVETTRPHYGQPLCQRSTDVTLRNLPNVLRRSVESVAKFCRRVCLQEVFDARQLREGRSLEYEFGV